MYKKKRLDFRCVIGLGILNVLFVLTLNAQQTKSLVGGLVVEKTPADNNFPVVSVDKSAASLRYDEADWKGVIRAIGDLQTDINSVTGIKPKLLTTETMSDYEIVVGTLGKSKLIDQLVKAKKLDVKDLKDKWETFVITTIPNPQPNAKK